MNAISVSHQVQSGVGLEEQCALRVGATRAQPSARRKPADSSLDKQANLLIARLESGSRSGARGHFRRDSAQWRAAGAAPPRGRLATPAAGHSTP